MLQLWPVDGHQNQLWDPSCSYWWVSVILMWWLRILSTQKLCGFCYWIVAFLRDLVSLARLSQENVRRATTTLGRISVTSHAILGHQSDLTSLVKETSNIYEFEIWIKGTITFHGVILSSLGNQTLYELTRFTKGKHRKRYFHSNEHQPENQRVRQVKAVTYFVSNEFNKATYDSCKNVQYPETSDTV